MLLIYDKIKNPVFDEDYKKIKIGYGSSLSNELIENEFDGYISYNLNKIVLAAVIDNSQIYLTKISPVIYK